MPIRGLFNNANKFCKINFLCKFYNALSKTLIVIHTLEEQEPDPTN